MSIKPSLRVITRCVLFCGLFSLAACAPGHRSAAPGDATDQGTVVSTAARRADPGYLQYLERLSMSGNQAELARVVSGSQLAWLRPAGAPLPAPLLSLANTWLSINPLVTLPETKKTVFASFTSPLYWQILGKARIGGLYIAPANGAGSLWAYNRKASVRGDDVIQYTFSEAAGTEDDYFRLLDAANTNRKLLGLELTPAATGLGPDFFLAARYHRQFAGIYCMVELPQKIWDSLPAVADQWRGEPLDGPQIALLAKNNLLPANMVQDFLSSGKEGGWAVTGEIHGVDGIARRWAYRYHESPDRPVLNWEDPSAGARRILSGSAIRSVGMLGSALVGMRMDGLYGLDAAPSQRRPRFTASPGDDAAISISREVRRYGGWAWLQDEIPLSVVRDLMTEGPDFFRDTVFSPGVEHALLTGSTTLLETMTDEALVLGLDMRRFVHATSGERGVDYGLAHLADVASGNTDASLLSPAAAGALRKNVLNETMNAVFAAKYAAERGDDKAPLRDRVLHTTPAGLAALALGAGNAEAVEDGMVPMIRDGHFLQILFRAMLPGLFMLSGQDMAGALPLSWRAMSGKSEGWDIALASRGAHAFTQSISENAITAQGVPRAKTVYPTPDIQLLEDDSFIARLSEILAIRTGYDVANGTLHGRFEATAPGCFAFAVILPGAGRKDDGQTAVPRPAGETAKRATAAPGGEAVISSSAATRAPSATERQKRRHEADEQARRALGHRIITAPRADASPRPGDAALVVVCNFSRETIRQVLNLYHDPTLRRIRQQGDPKLLTKGTTNGGEPGIAMTNGEQTVTLTLKPWRGAVVLIGKP